jgi:hypothetical protein
MRTTATSAEAAPNLRPSADPRLHALLDSLRHRGFILTPEDHRRLAVVFPPDRPFSRDQARAALTALLAKDEAQRRTLQRLFDQMFPPEPEGEARSDTERAGRHSPQWDVARVAKRPTASAKPPRTPFWSRRNAVLGVGAGLSLTLAVAVLLYTPRGYWIESSTEPSQEAIAPPAPAEKPADPLALPTEPVELFHTWVPVIEVDPAGALTRLAPPLALFLGAALGLAWLWQRVRDRTRLAFRVPPLGGRGRR